MLQNDFVEHLLHILHRKRYLYEKTTSRFSCLKTSVLITHFDIIAKKFYIKLCIYDERVDSEFTTSNLGLSQHYTGTL